MLPYSAPSGGESGFTLVEAATVTIVAGIVSALAVTSFIGLLKRMEVNNATAKLQGSIQEVQQQAIKEGKTCSLAIDTVNKKISGTGTCQAASYDLPSEITIQLQNSGVNPTFNYRGQTNTLQTIVLANASQSNKKCIVISNGIGTIVVGDYTGSLNSSITESNCVFSRM